MTTTTTGEAQLLANMAESGLARMGVRDPAHYMAGLTVADGMKLAAALRSLSAERDALAEKADKFMWQVRDTCKRAEKAEAERDALAAECARMREALEQINRRDTLNADSYGQFAQIARAALGARAS